ncbi:MAG: AAA family ATPase [Myxococcales bacterium]|nr:AAA family ATPase [Myxococcales bacterium]MCB9530681.1 AAA family ATPase [Myxococcales bacterium]MCB9533602.1 AAA family ATPase [Myxococcales bacterium]
MEPIRLSARASAALSAAATYAGELGHAALTPAHLLVALVSEADGNAARLLRHLGAAPQAIERGVHAQLAKTRAAARPPAPPDAGLRTLTEAAAREATRDGAAHVSTPHLLAAIADGPPEPGRRALEAAGVTRAALRFAIRELRDALLDEGAAVAAPTTDPVAPVSTGAAPSGSRTRNGGPSPAGGILAQFGRDLTALARAGELDPIVGRDVEIRRMMQILGRRSKNNPILVGEPGVGKTAVVEGFAHHLVSDDLPFGLRDKRLIEIDLGALVAGTTLRGQFEERIRGLLAEVEAARGSVILYFDEIHTIATEGGAANLLKPALARGQVTIIGTTTPAEYRAHFESDKALERRFQEIFVDEPSEADAIAILRGIKDRYEIHHRVRILDDALVAAVRLGERYVTDRKLPDKAVDLIDEAASRLRLQIDSQPSELADLERRLAQLEVEAGDRRGARAEGAAAEVEQTRTRIAELRARLAEEKALLDALAERKAEIDATRRLVDQAQADGDLGRVAELRYAVLPKLEERLKDVEAGLDALHKTGRLIREEVSEQDIALVVGDWTGVPTTKMLEGERQKLLAIEGRLGAQVVGQPQAVTAIAAAVRRSRAGLQDRNRPIGNFFFVGPTGVGKTELAKALAEFLFDSGDALIRIDMSEYMEQSKVNTLIGAAFGYVDSDKGGILTEAVRRRPYSVVLFDEAEKAHPDVFNILLQVLDEGRLSDSQGRKIDFTNTIIIMTSNVGARQILDLTGRIPYAELDEKVHTILRDHFKPEFLNRLDDTVVFNALDREAMARIAEILFRKLDSLLADQGLRIELSDAAKGHIIDVGYQPEYGARPLKRALLTEVQDPLATLVLDGTFSPGDTIAADLDPERKQLVFRHANRA